MLRVKEKRESSLRIDQATKKLIVQARGCLEHKDGKRRSLEGTVKELCEKEIRESDRRINLSF